MTRKKVPFLVTLLVIIDVLCIVSVVFIFAINLEERINFPMLNHILIFFISIMFIFTNLVGYYLYSPKSPWYNARVFYRG